jgi:2,3-bisphosphoglycerate-independent phosphoglycerate mutase
MDIPSQKNILPMLVILLDGWGLSSTKKGNATLFASTPTMNKLVKEYPFTTLKAHGKYAGLPMNPPQVGNSEAGHMNIGAGRIVEQESVRINRSIKNGTFYKNAAFTEAIRHQKNNKSDLHIMGIVSSGMSPHSNNEHLYALLRLARKNNVKNIYLHLFTDGRDSPKFEGIKVIEKIKGKLRENEKIATVMGRFYAMDRKKKWDRTKKAYEALVCGRGNLAKSTQVAISSSYNSGESDEYIKPVIISKEKNKCQGRIKDNDAVIFFNLRSDRARQLAKIFVQDSFKKFNPGAPKRKKVLKNIKFIAMTDFGPDLDSIITAYPGVDIEDTLPMALEGISQIYMAESEKYAHITYFFNGGYSQEVNGEDYYMVDSPNVKSYDQTPGMKSEHLTKKILNSLNKNKYDFTFVNFAAPDMIGHTGNLKAGIECCEKLDTLVGRLVKEYLDKNGTIIITADHGNIEQMINPETGGIETRHTTNQVPFIVVNKKLKSLKLKKNGKLADIAPTIIELLGLKKFKKMTGTSLIKNK